MSHFFATIAALLFPLCLALLGLGLYVVVVVHYAYAKKVIADAKRDPAVIALLRWKRNRSARG